MENLLKKNWITFLGKVMKEQGCPYDIRTTEDIIQNLYYLSKEDNKGSRYIPLQYKRVLEKLIFGAFNTSFEYEDGKDVYFEKIDGTLICTANVYWVQFIDGQKKILGHGFHSMALSEVMSGIFMTDEERKAKWKSTVIGGAKSRALHDGGIGLEFYGDIFAPEINLDEAETKDDSKNTSSEEKDNNEYSASGLPIPKAKRRGRPKKETENDVTDISKNKDTENVNISIEKARNTCADIGNYKGLTLGEIYEVAPKNLIFLLNNSKNKDVISSAKVIVRADKELLERFGE